MSAAPLFLTSLAPSHALGPRYADQTRAVASWQSLEARILSANPPDEIPSLQQTYPEIIFIPLERDARSLAGRPVPFIDDLLHLGKHHAEGRPFVLLNSDIVLATPAFLLEALLREAAQGALLCGARFDVENTQTALTALQDGTSIDGEVALGYDYFIVPSELPDRLPPSRLALGMAFWDYWLPLLAHLTGSPLRHIEAPIALHRRHPTCWTDSKFTFFRFFLDSLFHHFAAAESRHELRPGDYLTWQMIQYEYALLLEKAQETTASKTAQDAARSALADFYDRQFAVIMHCLRQARQPLPLF